jgi:hypothetical protein
MKEINGDIWELAEYMKAYVIIPTNGFVKNNGECVMGRGLALQATRRFPRIAKMIGGKIKRHGNHVFIFDHEKIITFPVKHNWWEPAHLSLIERSAIELRMIERKGEFILIPHVGCGNGKRSWDDVKPILEKYLSDCSGIIICNYIGKT